jgi:hypothetical protein
MSPFCRTCLFGLAAAITVWAAIRFYQRQLYFDPTVLVAAAFPASLALLGWERRKKAAENESPPPKSR